MNILDKNNILVIDTSTETCVVGLSVDGNTYNRELSNLRQHSKFILEFIAELLLQCKLELKHVNAIGFGIGPGSFTGVRIAASVAQALAVSNNIPLVGFSSLQVLAQTAFVAHKFTLVAPTIDARKSEIYYGIYGLDKVSNIMQPLIKDTISSPNDIICPDNNSLLNFGEQFIDNFEYNNNIKPINNINSINIVGTGLNYENLSFSLNNKNTKVYDDKFIRGIRQLKCKSIIKPNAKAMVDISIHKLTNNETLNLNEAIPTYIRDNVTG